MSRIAPPRERMRSMTDEGDDRAAAPRPGRWIPRPTIPVLPVLSAASFFALPGGGQPCALDRGEVVWLPAGRLAFALALALEGVGPGDEVLVPAFHCMSMVEPVVLLGARPVFYRIRPGLDADLDDLAAKCGPSVKAVLAANYFGFPQPWDALRSFCDRRSLPLIEDCAHSLFGRWHGRPLGGFGDYAIVSLTKFLPVWDGGCLVSRRRAARLEEVELDRQSVADQIRALLGPVEIAVEYGRLPVLRPLLAAARRARRAVSRGGAAQPVNPARLQSGGRGGTDMRWARTRISAASRFLTATLARDRIVRQRRAAWLAYQDALSGLPGCRPLLPDLPEDVVPHTFPLWVDDLARLFPLMEDAALPVQRFGQFLWTGRDDDLCPVSAGLSRHLVQLPCNQDLSPDEIAWIIATFRAVLTS